jgi:prephenate dehydratase
MAGIAEVTGSGIAAIGQPERLGENLAVLAESIQPDGNATRFLVVAQRGLGLPIEAQVDRAIFVVAIRDEPGSLVRALAPMASCQLTEIFSVPKPDDRGRGERIFWVDLQFDGIDLPQLEYDLKRKAVDCLINLGAYPAIPV